VKPQISSLTPDFTHEYTPWLFAYSVLHIRLLLFPGDVGIPFFFFFFFGRMEDAYYCLKQCIIYETVVDGYLRAAGIWYM